MAVRLLAEALHRGLRHVQHLAEDGNLLLVHPAGLLRGVAALLDVQELHREPVSRGRRLGLLVQRRRHLRAGRGLRRARDGRAHRLNLDGHGGCAHEAGRVDPRTNGGADAASTHATRADGRRGPDRFDRGQGFLRARSGDLRLSGESGDSASGWSLNDQRRRGHAPGGRLRREVREPVHGAPQLLREASEVRAGGGDPWLHRRDGDVAGGPLGPRQHDVRHHHHALGVGGHDVGRFGGARPRWRVNA
mmetsp:Transcript_21753/g.64850  ORF Transcript_21753/g.64850 Transcript_21753/m.64850 type:complete len:248 (+) Transcript_21753:996-1739(+)